MAPKEASTIVPKVKSNLQYYKQPLEKQVFTLKCEGVTNEQTYQTGPTARQLHFYRSIA